MYIKAINSILSTDEVTHSNLFYRVQARGPTATAFCIWYEDNHGEVTHSYACILVG